LADIVYHSKRPSQGNGEINVKICGWATTGVGEDAGKKEPSYTVGGNVD
jgi:hypothetical protein